MSSCNDRRGFLRNIGTAICAGAGSTFLPQLNLIGSALANNQGVLPGYKALVCVYLAGGNDSFNLLAPRDSVAPASRYNTYKTARGGVFNANSNPLGLALDFNSLLDLGTPIGQASAFGAHPQVADYAVTRTDGTSYQYPGLHTLFGASQQKLAFIANVGPLVQPITMNEFLGGAPAPAQLYSHSDQELLWHMADTNPSATHGWGGRFMDQLGTTNALGLSPCISIAGNARFQIGGSVFPYQMSASTGVAQLENFSGQYTFGDQRRLALDDLLAQAYPQLMTQEYRNVLSRSRDLAAALTTALTSSAGRIFTPYDYSGFTAPNPAGNVYPDANLRLFSDDYSNPLLDQLRMVARMIKASRDPAGGINQSRQVYYVRLDGFDTHSDLMDRHPLLIARLSQALGWFWQVLGEIGAQNEVATFTMSEFGRTLSSNGDGSDHAWGGVQLVLGGEVIGQRIYGQYPLLTLNANDNANQNWSFSRGQYIPTTANDQMAATLARWMGVPDSELGTVFPNLINFPGPLGFLPA